MMERTQPRWERWLAVAGIAYVVLHFLFLTHGGTGPEQSIGAVQRAFTDAPAQEMQSGVLYQVSALVLLLFAISLRAHLRPAEGEPRTLSTVVLGAALAASASALVTGTLPRWIGGLGVVCGLALVGG